MTFAKIQDGKVVNSRITKFPHAVYTGCPIFGTYLLRISDDTMYIKVAFF